MVDPELRQALEDFAARIEREFSETLRAFEREVTTRIMLRLDELELKILELLEVTLT